MYILKIREFDEATNNYGDYYHHLEEVVVKLFNTLDEAKSYARKLLKQAEAKEIFSDIDFSNIEDDGGDAINYDDSIDSYGEFYISDLDANYILIAKIKEIEEEDLYEDQ